MPKVSVIVPCHNVTKYLGKAMDQLLHQTIGLENMEIILVDNASTDDGATLAMLMDYESRYPEQIIVIPLKEDMKPGGARNVGLLYATGEYIAFCDADDWFLTGAFERLYGLAEKFDCDVVEFITKGVRDYNEFDEIIPGGGVLWEVKSTEERKRNLTAPLIGRSSLSCLNKLYRGSMLRENHIRYAEQVFWEETPFTFMVRFYEKRHLTVNEVLYLGLQHDGSATRSDYEGRKYDNMAAHEGLLLEFINRGAMDEYQEEIEYIFWWWYFFSTLMWRAAKRLRDEKVSFYTREEFILMQQRTAAVVRDIGSNRYFQENYGWMPQLAELTYCKADFMDMEELCQTFVEIFKTECARLQKMN